MLPLLYRVEQPAGVAVKAGLRRYLGPWVGDPVPFRTADLCTSKGHKSKPYGNL